MDPQFTNLAVLPLVRGQEVSFGSIANPFDIWDLYTDASLLPVGAIAEARLYATSAAGQRYLVGTLPIAAGSGVARGTFLLTSDDVPFSTVYASPYYVPKDSLSGGTTWELRIIGISAESQGATLGAVLVGYSYSEPVADDSQPPAPVSLTANFVPTLVATINAQHQYHDASVDFAPLMTKPTRWELFASAVTPTGTLRTLVVRKDFPANFSNKVETIFQAVTNVGAVVYELVGTDLSGVGSAPLTVSLEGYNSNLNGGGVTPGGNTVTQPIWHVNALTGNDGNDGLTALTALQTLHELTQVRWGDGALLDPSSADRTMQVLIDSPIPPTDPLVLDVVLGADVSLIFRGTTFTPIFSGALTGVTALNRVANQSFDITDVAAPWGANTGQRIRNTTAGPRLNSVAYIAADLGAGTARINPPWINLFVGNIPVFLTAGSFVALDTYNIESLPTITVSTVTIQGYSGVSGLTPPTMDFVDLDVSGAPNAYVPFNVGAGTTLQSFASRFPQADIFGGTENFFNSMFKDGVLRTDGAAGAAIFGGLSLNANGFFAAGGVGSSMILAFDFTVQGSALNLFGTMIIDDVGVFDSPTNGANTNPVLAFCFVEVIVFLGTGSFYGVGNANTGVHLGSNATLVYANAATLTITGTAAGDFECGAVGNLDTPDPATWNFTGAIAQSWANLAAARAAGFGGTVINPANMARILPFVA